MPDAARSLARHCAPKTRNHHRQYTAHNPAAAKRSGAAIRHTADHLPDHPYMYRPGRVAGTREALVHPNYVIIYRVRAGAIQILALIHTRQQYP
ncbi:type II toxin-antitoxin system RelE/ParE family toxin [Sphingobium sp. AN558]|uniref:type II toxin-antitoxin system RelE/ParE family toxin n=1 Tax=Sphingobium sp. AN558 TaxID=3133442 RepID=UPI0030C3DD9E